MKKITLALVALAALMVAPGETLRLKATTTVKIEPRDQTVPTKNSSHSGIFKKPQPDAT